MRLPVLCLSVQSELMGKKKKKKTLPGLLVRLLLLLLVTDPISALWDRVREKEKEERKKAKERGEEGRGRGRGRGSVSADEERGEESEGEGERVPVDGEREQPGQRGESGDSGALTQRRATLKGICWQWEVVLLSQMTSASLLKSIG